MYRLRELERGDIERINVWRNDPALTACLGAPYRYINKEVDMAWFDKYMSSRGNSVRCAIVDDKEIIGLISLMDIDAVNRSATLHIMIGEAECQGKGAGSFAVKTMLEHAFLNLNLRRIELSVLENNLPAICLYIKNGFVKEGVKRQSTYKNGMYFDMILMGLLRSEWSRGRTNPAMECCEDAWSI